MTEKADVIRHEAEIEGILSTLVSAVRAEAVARDTERRLPVDVLDRIAVCRGVASADPSVSEYFQPHFAAVDVIARVCDEAQKRQLFADVLARMALL